MIHYFLLIRCCYILDLIKPDQWKVSRLDGGFRVNAFTELHKPQHAKKTLEEEPHKTLDYDIYDAVTMFPSFYKENSL